MTAAISQAEGSGYRPEIDGLRAVAVVAVMLFHTSLDVATGGYVGVDVFLVISGYLISSIILRERAEGRFTYVGFYERRIRRIFPALFVVLATTSAACWFFLPPEALQTYSQSLVATLLFVSNVFLLWKSGYFGGDAELFPLLHMWSLSVEEQYYVFFPVLALLGFLSARRFLGPLMIGVFTVSLAACLFFTRQHAMTAFFLMPLRAWELLAGVFVALYETRWRPHLLQPRGLMPALEVVGATAVMVPIFLFDRHTEFPGGAAIVPVFGTALLILVCHRTSLLGRVLASPPFVGIGLISYSAYLWHQPLYAFARVLGVAEHGAPVFAVLFVATLLLAWLSWRFVERPFRRRDGFTRRQIYAGFFALSALLVAAGVAGHFSHGFPGRYDRATLAVNATAIGSPKLLECHASRMNPLTPETSCRYFTDEVHWAVLGDSHGVELSYAMAEALRPAGQGVLQLTYTDCQPALHYPSVDPGCARWIRQTLTWLERSNEITDVIVTFRHTYHLFGDQTKSFPRPAHFDPAFLTNLSPDKARQVYVDDFSELVRRLSEAGMRVYVVLPTPDLPTHVERYIFAHDRDRPGRATGVSREFYARENAYVLPFLTRLGDLPNVTLLDPTQAFCDATRCASIIDGHALYYDDDHPSLDGARRFVATERARGLLNLPPPRSANTQ